MKEKIKAVFYFLSIHSDTKKKEKKKRKKKIKN